MTRSELTRAAIPIILLILVVVVSARGHFGSQIKYPQSTRHKSLNATASCYDDAGKSVGSHASRTSLLVSPDGRFRAYAESGAVAGELPNAPECRNTSKLFIAGLGQSFHAVLSIEPSAEALGNSIEIIDWSPTGHRLLLEQGFWQYHSDVGRTVVRIYDADSDNLSSEPFVDDAFSRYAGKKCAVILRPLGFSRDGDTVVRAEPYFDYGEDQVAEDSCVQKRGLWLVNFAIPSLQQASRYTPQQFGRIAP